MASNGGSYGTNRIKTEHMSRLPSWEQGSLANMYGYSRGPEPEQFSPIPDPIKIVANGDLIVVVGRNEPGHTKRAFVVNSLFLGNASRLWADKIARETTTSTPHPRGDRPILRLPNDIPDAFEMLANKLHRGKCILTSGDEPETKSWILLAQLAFKYQCIGSLWCEADYWLRTKLRIWTLSRNTQKLWDGMVVAHWVGSSEWFSSYSKRLSCLHDGSFSVFGSRMNDQILGFKLARK